MKKFIIPIIFLLGIGVFSYPIISNIISTKEHHTVINKYNEDVANMSETEKKHEIDKAAEYNAALNESQIPMVDPFADDFKEEDAHNGYYNILDIGETIGSLEIPDLNVDLPIYHGVGEDVLSQGIGHMSNSSFPIGGKGSHTALTGHRGLPTAKLFRDLDKLKKGDLFFVHTLDDTLAYKVDDIQIVLPTETNWLTLDKDHDYVTLITCDPYMINSHRLLVRGERTPYHPEKMAPVKSPSADTGLPILVYILGGISALLLLIWLLRKWRRKHLQQGGM